MREQHAVRRLRERRPRDRENVCDLLEINESIRRTITKITHLEHVLYSKLEPVTRPHKRPDDCKGEKDCGEKPDKDCCGERDGDCCGEHDGHRGWDDD